MCVCVFGVHEMFLLVVIECSQRERERGGEVGGGRGGRLHLRVGQLQLLLMESTSSFIAQSGLNNFCSLSAAHAPRDTHLHILSQALNPTSVSYLDKRVARFSYTHFAVASVFTTYDTPSKPRACA